MSREDGSGPTTLPDGSYRRRWRMGNTCQNRKPGWHVAGISNTWTHGGYTYLPYQSQMRRRSCAVRLKGRDNCLSDVFCSIVDVPSLCAASPPGSLSSIAKKRHELAQDFFSLFKGVHEGSGIARHACLGALLRISCLIHACLE